MKTQAGLKRDLTPNKTITFEQEVRQQILALISKYRRNINQAPPFSRGELIIIALLLARQPLKPLRASEILAWILKAFKYFNNRAIDEYAEARIRGGHVDFERDSNVVVRDVFDAFNYYGLPIYSPSGKIVTVECAEDSDLQFTTTAAEGRIFLRKWLDRDLAREHPFEFVNHNGHTNTLLKLPPEMRKIIFEMVFAFKWPGLVVRNNEYRAFKRIHDPPENNAYKTTLRVPSRQSMLALLSVSKEVYREALPCFYSENYFYFDSIHAFALFAQRTAPDRRALLRNIILMYNNADGGPTGFEQAAKLLSKFRKLRNLEISSLEATWFDTSVRQDVGGGGVFKRTKYLPGINDIAFSLHRAANYKIYGECPRIRRFLEDQLDKFAKADKTREVEKLRRAEELANAKSFKDAKASSDFDKANNSRKRKTREMPPSEYDAELDGFDANNSKKVRDGDAENKSDKGSSASESGDDLAKNAIATAYAGWRTVGGSDRLDMVDEDDYYELDQYAATTNRGSDCGSDGAISGSEGRSAKRRKGY